MDSKTFKAAALFFVTVYFLHALTPVSIQGDSRWTIPTALNIIHRGSVDMRPYAPAIAASEFYATECVTPDKTYIFPITSLDQCPGGSLYNFHPVAVAIIAVPFTGALEAAIRVSRPILAPLAQALPHPWVKAFASGDLAGASPIVENLISSFFTAGAATVIYLAALEFLPAFTALLLALVFAFGTLLWSVVCHALWQHSPSIFLNSLLLLILIRKNEGRPWLVLTGFVLALSFFIRPSNAVPVAVFGIYLVWRWRGRALWAVAGGLPPSIFFVWLNLHMYGKVLAPYFLPVRQGSSSLALQVSFWQALPANLFSPARGLFVFMPFFLLLLAPQVWREKTPACLSDLRPWLGAVVVLHMALIATQTDWWGGFSYGPRYMSDVLPYLILLWSPALLVARRVRAFSIAAAALVLGALFVQFRGATSIQVHHWSSTPVSVNLDNRRIWDWTDPPFLRGLTR